jgi:lysophospholipase L1-like esterase
MYRRLSLAVLLAGLCVMLGGASAAAAAPSYVALGDSYASGDGTGVYYNTTCYTSPYSYPPLVAARAGYALTFAACSGATTSSVISSQLGSLNAATALVTIQVGGNDAGFTSVMESCALYYFTCQSSINNADNYIQNSLPAALNRTYSDIRADAPNAKVLVVGYPHLFTAAGATCGFNLLTSSHERSLNQTADLLDGVIASAAAGHSFTFIDPRASFASHELCSSAPWLNNDTIPVQESYHPNIPGEAAYASLVEAGLLGFVGVAAPRGRHVPAAPPATPAA